jgi:hypothetical protein
MEVDLARLAREEIAQLVSPASARDIELSLDAPDSLAATVDPQLFRSVLTDHRRARSPPRLSRLSSRHPTVASRRRSPEPTPSQIRLYPAPRRSDNRPGQSGSVA